MYVIENYLQYFLFLEPKILLQVTNIKDMNICQEAGNMPNVRFCSPVEIQHFCVTTTIFAICFLTQIYFYPVRNNNNPLSMTLMFDVSHVNPGRKPKNAVS